MLYEEQTFSEQTVEVDGNEYLQCAFDHSILIYSGSTPVRLERNTFVDLRFALKGPALNTVVFLASLYQQDGQAKEAVETLFQGIRQGLLSM